MPAVAVADTNNIFGAMEFSDAAASAGVQPIIGCALSVNMEAKEPAPGEELPKLVFLARNDAGYRSLLKLLSQAYMKTPDHLEPHVVRATLENHAEGLIVLTGGAAGPVGRLILDGRQDEAKLLVDRLAALYPGCLYMEIQRHGAAEEKKTEPAFLDFAYAGNIPLVATNQCFFSGREFYEAHDALICIAAGTYVSQEDRRRLTPEHGFKSPEEMRAIFKDLPEACDNTLVVAKRCAFKVDRIAPILPPYDRGEGRTEADELRVQSEKGLEGRLRAHVFAEHMDEAARNAAAKPYRDRLDFELRVIAQMGFPGYFLIVADFIRWAKDRGIPVGPGRGSGAGSVVAWALSITDLDPLRWGLLFERFLNPERVSMPDFDIDFCQDRRDEVIKYVQDKYGRDRVAQIITFGKLQARAVLRDVGRVLEMPYGRVDKICKLVPNNPANPRTLSEAIEEEPRLREQIDRDPAVRRLVEVGGQLEGLYRHASTHAAGVVIGDRPLDELVPLYRDPKSDMPVTGYSFKFVESAGLVKFDFLGLKTLTVLAEAVRNVKRAGKGDLDLSTIPLDDPETFEMLTRGETVGVFQLESAGMRDVLRKLRPDAFEDIIAVVALYRPGPMDNIPRYIAVKHGEEQPDYLYPTLKPILEETHGIMIYQEQVMRIAQELSGYSLGGADLLRRAMGKKIKEEMDKQREIFVAGARERGVEARKASDIFDQVAKFAGYGFNKSHAAAYALVAYRTAYLKANYPTEFLAASMTLDLGNTDKINVFRQEGERLGIALRGPDANVSDTNFKVEATGRGIAAIRYALPAVKGVGRAAMADLVTERNANGPFKDIDDLAARLDTRVLNKRPMENLVRAGALECLNPNRRQVFEGLETILKTAAAAAVERNSNQMGLFGGEAAPNPKIKLPEVKDWPPMERLAEEFSAIGFYLSAHPLDSYAKILKRVGAEPALEIAVSGGATLAGTLISMKERISQKGSRYAFVTFSDTSGIFEVMCFSETLNAAGELLTVGNSLCMRVVASEDDGGGMKFRAESFEDLDAVAARTGTGLRIRVAGPEALPALKTLLDAIGRGKGEIKIDLTPDPDYEVTMTLPDRYRIDPSVTAEARDLRGVLGVEEV